MKTKLNFIRKVKVNDKLIESQKYALQTLGMINELANNEDDMIECERLFAKYSDTLYNFRDWVQLHFP